MVDRRSFLKIVSGIAATALPLASSAYSRGVSGVRVVIIGGGVAGIRAAARLKHKVPRADVTLIDPAGNGKTNPFAKLNSTVRLDSAAILSKAGIRVLAHSVVEADPVSKRLLLQDGSNIDTDLLVFAPGVEFKHDNPVSHPLNYRLLQRRLEAMRNGDNVIVSIPEAPYQYPQGPYINISRIGKYLNADKPASKVIVFDHNSGSSMAELYRRQWSRAASTARIERIEVAAGFIQAADCESGIIDTQDGAFEAGVIALMQEQRAAGVARKAGLSLKEDWCQVNQHTLESLHYPDVYVIGDANDAAQNDKTAFLAVQQADAFVTSIAGRVA